MNIAAVYVGCVVQLFGVCGVTLAVFPSTAVSMMAMSHQKFASTSGVNVPVSVSAVIPVMFTPVRVAVGVLVMTWII